MTRDELKEMIRCSLFNEQDTEDIMTAVDAYSSASNDAKPHVSGSLPPSLIYIDKLIPVAKTELKTIVDLIGHDAIVLTRLVSKVEEYLAAMTV